MTYSLDFNEQVRLGMVDADESPACTGCGDADCRGDCVYCTPCPGCGKTYCTGECPGFLAYMADAWRAYDRATAAGGLLAVRSANDTFGRLFHVADAARRKSLCGRLRLDDRDDTQDRAVTTDGAKALGLCRLCEKRIAAPAAAGDARGRGDQ